MLINIFTISDAGIPNQERLVLKVWGFDNLGNYIVFNTQKSILGGFSSSPKNVFWFPDKNVKIGDLIVLYTKKGVPSQSINKDGSTTHFYFWGQEKTLWNNNFDGAVIIRAENWNFAARG